MPSINAKSALITGGAGFIGSHLAEALLERGYRVSVIDNLSTGRFENIAHLTDSPRFDLTVDSIHNEATLDALAQRCSLIFHLAAVVGVQLAVREPSRVMETNVLGTHTLLKVASRHSKKVLFASSSEVYGKNDAMPLAEDDNRVLGPTTTFRWGYSISKAAGEVMALAQHQQHGLPVVIFRLFNTVGPRQTGRYGMVVPRLVQQALRGEPLTVYGDGLQTRSFCHVSDAVRAIIKLAECPEAVGQVFNVGSTEEVSVLELARKIIKLVDALNGRPMEKRQSSDRIAFIPYEQAFDAAFEDMRRRVPDVSKIRRLLGWLPEYSLDRTLADIVASFREQEGIAGR
ncbi:MAG: GDP-mannose 4,6-dehydratase [Chloroflexi bacterium]|nr:GDP-mannose 4,6-dehydratase [Chloroflexota bacterium]